MITNPISDINVNTKCPGDSANPKKNSGAISLIEKPPTRISPADRPPTKISEVKRPPTTPAIPEESPTELKKLLFLSISEFVNSGVDVIKTNSEEALQQPSSIGEAISHFHTPKENRSSSSCFTLLISADKDCNEEFPLPEEIANLDLVTNFWPHNYGPTYMTTRSKMFYSFQSGYKSRPQVAYAGALEWMYVIHGKVKLLLARPTNLNLFRLRAAELENDFKPEDGTWQIRIMERNQIITIPSGWIVIREALEDTHAYAGEFLHYLDISTQLDCFKRDAHRGLFLDRERDIRALYWMSAAKILEMPENGIFQSIGYHDVNELYTQLKDWASKAKLLQPFCRSLYVPAGLTAWKIIDSLRRARCRKLPTGKKLPEESLKETNLTGDPKLTLGEPPQKAIRRTRSRINVTVG